MSERRKTEKDKDQLINLVLKGNFEKIAFFMDGSWKPVSKKFTYVANKNDTNLFKIIRKNTFTLKDRASVAYSMDRIFDSIRLKKLKELLYLGDYEKIIFTFEGWKSVGRDYVYTGNFPKKKIITWIKKEDYPKLTRRQVDILVAQTYDEIMIYIDDGLVQVPSNNPRKWYS